MYQSSVARNTELWELIFDVLLSICELVRSRSTALTFACVSVIDQTNVEEGKKDAETHSAGLCADTFSFTLTVCQSIQF